MIQVNNILVRFDREIIRNGHISIEDGTVTAITGDSGSGKTTLLYLLGLISSNRSHEYYYEGQKLNLLDKKVISGLRRRDFGFLLQDNSLIDTLTVEENMKYTANLAEVEISHGEMISILRRVLLDESVLDKYPKQLSGGEQQRAALASILAKHPRYIFADEPTSALDKINTEKVTSIFRQLADEGLTIVLATHSDALCDAADVVYRIDDCEIVEGKTTEKKRADTVFNAFLNNKFSTHKRGFKDKLWYSAKSNRKNRALKVVITVFCALAITGFSLSESVLDALKETQADMINQISDREIFVVNQDIQDEEVLDKGSNPSIPEEDYLRIKSIIGVDEVLPYYEFRSFCLEPDFFRLGTDVTVDSEKGNYTTRYGLDEPGSTYFIVVPYSSYRNLPKQLEVCFDDEAGDMGIYVSHDMAEALKIDEYECDIPSLSFEIGVPVRKIESKETVNGQEVVCEEDALVFSPVEFEISGIVSANIANRYSINGKNIIYAPYEIMDEILAKVNAEYTDIVPSNEAGEKRTAREWRPSAYSVFTASFDSVTAVRGKIENISPSFSTKSDYQDVETLQNLVATIKSTSDIVLTVLLFVIFVLMSAVFIYITFSRKREFAILKANGMSNGDMASLMIADSLMQGLKIMMLATAVSLVLSIIGSAIMTAEVTILSVSTLIIVLVTSITFVCIPTIVGISFTLRLEPDKILRN